jgi:hypothetical protein
VATAGRSVAAEEWLAEFDSGFARIAGRLGRVEPRRQARAYLFGLLSDVDTQTCWQLAEQAGGSGCCARRCGTATGCATTCAACRATILRHSQIAVTMDV